MKGVCAVLLGLLLAATIALQAFTIAWMQAIHSALVYRDRQYAFVSPSDDQVLEELRDIGLNGWEVVSARRAVSNREARYEFLVSRPMPEPMAPVVLRSPFSVSPSPPASGGP